MNYGKVKMFEAYIHTLQYTVSSLCSCKPNSQHVGELQWDTVILQNAVNMYTDTFVYIIQKFIDSSTINYIKSYIAKLSKYRAVETLAVKNIGELQHFTKFFTNFHNFHNISYANGLQFTKLFYCQRFLLYSSHQRPPYFNKQP